MIEAETPQGRSPYAPVKPTVAERTPFGPWNTHALAGRDAIAAAKPALPRLADLAVHGEAAREALGWEPGKAIALLRDHGIAARRRILAEDVVAQGVVAFARSRPGFAPWTGTATELAYALDVTAHITLKAAQLSTRLNRVAPTLRDAGITITRDQVGHSGRRTITIMLTPQTTAAGPESSTVSTLNQVNAHADSADSPTAVFFTQ